MSVDMINDTAYVVWGDTRNTFLNIWFHKIDLANSSSSIIDLANDVEEISVYPNPTIDVITIDIGGNELKNSQYEIFNITGKLITSNTIKNKKQLIDLTHFSKGNYLLKFTNNKGSKAIKIIKE